MAFEMNELLYNFDIYPKVFVVNKECEIHAQSNGGRAGFEPDTEYEMIISAINGGYPEFFPATGDFKNFKVKSDSNAKITFKHTFTEEQQYFIRFLKDDNQVVEFPVYCVDEDLCGRYPYMGDLHIHTTDSDGHESPEIVCANYRKHGYDFMPITDHGRYYPSLDAMNFYKDVPIDLNIVPGEEVHLPLVYGKKNETHIVNFGGEYSINALTEGNHAKEVGTSPERRSLYGKCPDYMEYDEFQEKMQKLADEIDVPEGIDAIPAALCKWTFDEIRKANGLGIFPHPYWVSRHTFQIPVKFTDYMMENQFFDAFEVLGGEMYYEHNGYQTHQYYDDRAKGRKYPIVGSTDTHGSNPLNKKGFICATIVFAHENERLELIDSIKKFYSVAIDKISKEFRLVGETRFARYGCFLLKNFFPLHDEICFEEGRLMKQYAIGTDEEKEEAAKLLNAMQGRCDRLLKKYFDF